MPVLIGLGLRPRMCTPWNGSGANPTKSPRWVESANRRKQTTPSLPHCPIAPLRGEATNQQDWQRLLFFAPRPSSSLIVSGNGEMRDTGPLAMSTVVWPRRLTTRGSAPFESR